MAVIDIFIFPASSHPSPEEKQWEQHLTTHLHVPTPFKEWQLHKLSTFMLFNSKIIQLQGTNLCFLDRGWRSWSSTGLRNMSTKIGWYFLNTTIDTVKLRSTLSILTRNSGGMFAMSAHFLLLLKNWIRLKHNSCYLYTVSLSTS